MNERLKIVLIVLLSLCSSSLVAQESDQNKEKRNSISCDIGSSYILEDKNRDIYEPYIKKVFSPSVQLAYNRTTWKGLCIGIEYNFLKSSAVAIDSWHVYPQKEYVFKNINHLFSISLSYNYKISNFFIAPQLAWGENYNVMKCSDFDDNYGIEPKSIFLFKPSIRCGYTIKNWMIYVSYNYVSYQRKILSREYMVNALSFPSEYKYHLFNIGVGFSF